MFVKSHDGVNIFYKIIRPKNPKGAIVFVHGGFYGNHSLLNRLAGFFPDYIIILPDLRGRGDSGFPKQPEKQKLEGYAMDLESVLAKEKLKSIILIGISFGGIVSLKFAQLFGEKVEKIILISSAHRLDRLNKPAKMLKPAYKALFGTLEAISNFFPESRRKSIDYTPEKERFTDLSYGIRILKNNSIRTISLRYKLMKAAEGYCICPGELRGIKQKILVIYGGKDFFFPISVQKELLVNTKSRFYVVKDGGHNIYYNKADELSIPIGRFIGARINKGSRRKP